MTGTEEGGKAGTGVWTTPPPPPPSQVPVLYDALLGGRDGSGAWCERAVSFFAYTADDAAAQADRRTRLLHNVDAPSRLSLDFAGLGACSYVRVLGVAPHGHLSELYGSAQ